MTSIPGLAYAGVVAAGWPLYEHFIDWPRFRRWLCGDPGRARLREYRGSILRQWAIVAVGIALWLRWERPGAELAIRGPHGWRLWLSLGVLALLAALYASQAALARRSSRVRARLREAVAPLEGLLPHTRRELAWFVALSLTAGACEELFFRGFLFAAAAPLAGRWGAVAIGAVAFGLLHAYQGARGVARTAVVGLAMSGAVALTRSLPVAMVLHALVDVGSGSIAWIALRDVAGGGEPAGEG